MMITLTPNPPCECGCGNEVSKPTHRFVLGHARSRKMTDEQIAEAMDMRKAGVSTCRIAKMYGVSPSRICCIDMVKKQGAIPQTTADTVRREQIEIRRAIKSMRKQMFDSAIDRSPASVAEEFGVSLKTAEWQIYSRRKKRKNEKST